MSPTLPIVNTALLIVVIASLAIMAYQSRRWTGPIQEARLRLMEDEVTTLRGNFSRLDRDSLAWHRESLETNHSILRHIAQIEEALRGRHPLEEKLDDVQARLVELEQTVSQLGSSA